jgi:hypothetical protein
MPGSSKFSSSINGAPSAPRGGASRPHRLVRDGPPILPSLACRIMALGER